MGAWVVWIVFTFCENAHFTLLELDLTPTWPILWSCDRVTALPILLLVSLVKLVHHLLGSKMRTKHWIVAMTPRSCVHLTQVIFWDRRQTDFPSPFCFLTSLTFSLLVTIPPPSLVRVAACFDSLSRHLLLPLENMFSQKALLTQVIQSIQCRVGPTCYSRQVPNMNWKYGYMHGLRLRWIRNFLRWDSEWNPALQTTEKIRHNTAQSARRRHKMNLGCQLNSLCSYSTCLLEY